MTDFDKPAERPDKEMSPLCYRLTIVALMVSNIRYITSKELR